jgi:phosphoglucomutase
MKISPYAGQLATPAMLVNVPKLIADYYAGVPDISVSTQRVMFGTSGHRGSSGELSFNEWHILAISQAVCDYRARQGFNGPLFLGIDTHALSIPASSSALEVLAANGVDVMLAHHDEFTPTPAISLAILRYNRARRSGLADGIVITPSHNPPDAGGFKYNPPNGGAADTHVTAWIEARANALMSSGLSGVRRMPHGQALHASTTHRYDYLGTYVNQLDQVIDMNAIRAASICMAVDPMGGAGVHYWGRIAEHYRLDLTVLNTQVDPSFAFMSVDWDGKIRMDPSSPFAMQSLLNRFERDHSYDIAFACDTDHDRHGIVTKSAGLLPTNHYLAVAIDYLFQHRPQWSAGMSIGKTVVSSEIINRVASKLDRRVVEVPAGFKWFADGLHDGILGFCGEESAGAAFARLDGTVWTSDKDGITAALLSAEISARTGMDPGEIYAKLASELGAPVGGRIDAVATPVQKKKLSSISAQQLQCGELAGEPIQHIFTNAPGNNAAIGGVKVVTENGWFAARPSGTEDIYKIYAESFRNEEHLQRILLEAQATVDLALIA